MVLTILLLWLAAVLLWFWRDSVTNDRAPRRRPRPETGTEGAVLDSGGGWFDFGGDGGCDGGGDGGGGDGGGCD